jgi:hypothetical protein
MEIGEGTDKTIKVPTAEQNQEQASDPDPIIQAVQEQEEAITQVQKLKMLR